MSEQNLPQGVPLRLYGRRRGHPLRPRQQRLLAETLPRLRLRREEIPALPRPLWLEVGFGGGEHTLAQIAAHPGVTYLASEVFENGLCSLLSALVPEGGEATAPLPATLRLWPEDARSLLAALPEGALERLFLLFPDPWPKARHAKRRFVHPAMLPVVARVLAPGGIWRIATDDPTYQEWLRETFAAQPFFAPHAFHAARPEGWPPTRYEAKALREGRRPLYWEWRRL
ncbi:MAG: tRNA (guanine(46)-N(7))-methyltransferase TrmB [Roseococcus sp.]|nr:tRNA (guanine(46)-N(7))-methyltransferase TrmB [Roseococcus sp.]